jgi:hypothetical protein
VDLSSGLQYDLITMALSQLGKFPPSGCLPVLEETHPENPRARGAQLTEDSHWHSGLKPLIGR